jgi:hypothetical protein
LEHENTSQHEGLDAGALGRRRIYRLVGTSIIERHCIETAKMLGPQSDSSAARPAGESMRSVSF